MTPKTNPTILAKLREEYRRSHPLIKNASKYRGELKIKKRYTLTRSEKDIRNSISRSKRLNYSPEVKARIASVCRSWSAANKEKLFFKRIWRKYGLTPDAFWEMVKDQEGCCAICTVVLRLSGNELNSLHIDHCHKTMKVRGLLCKRHNTAIGIFRENPEHLESAAAYLRRHQS